MMRGAVAFDRRISGDVLGSGQSDTPWLYGAVGRKAPGVGACSWGGAQRAGAGTTLWTCGWT